MSRNSADQNFLEDTAERIVVAVDGSPQSVAALHAAARLASLIEAELCGLFVEDQNLQRLCALPFSAEVGAYSATVRPLSTNCIPREFRALQTTMEMAVEEAARRANVFWSFQICTGDVNDELISASQTATIFGLGRSGHLPKKRLGSTARKVLTETSSPVLFPGHQPTQLLPEQQDKTTVVYTGTETANRALAFATRLAQRHESELRVLVGNSRTTTDARSQTAPSGAKLASHVANVLAERALAVHTIEEKQNMELFHTVQSTGEGLLILPLDYAEENRTILDATFAPVVLVS